MDELLIKGLFTAAGKLNLTQWQLLRIAEQLAAADGDTGWQLLLQVTRSTTERESLLRDARLCFNRAISLERGCRLAAAWFGLALCHVGLSDQDNATAALREFIRVEPEKPPLIDRILLTTEHYDKAIEQCRGLQRAAAAYLAKQEMPLDAIAQALEKCAADPV